MGALLWCTPLGDAEIKQWDIRHCGKSGGHGMETAARSHIFLC